MILFNPAIYRLSFNGIDTIQEKLLKWDDKFKIYQITYFEITKFKIYKVLNY